LRTGAQSAALAGDVANDHGIVPKINLAGTAPRTAQQSP
jgi:hypothetical protein